MPSIDRNSSKPFYQQFYEQIVEGIENGLYPAGKKLPSIRESARELDVSNTTIELAYQRLTEEGYVKAYRGSGYVICPTATELQDPASKFDDAYRAALDQLDKESTPKDASARIMYDFAYDSVDPSLFPFTAWARISREVFFEHGAHAACTYNDRQGLFELREQITSYLGKEYGVRAHASQILVMPTTRDLVRSILGLFEPSHTTVAMEEPGYNEVAGVLRSSGYKVKQVPLHPFPEWDEARKYIEGAHVVFCTPACQFPSNVTLPLEYRKSLLNWANENDAFLIDDEYGWEFQSGPARVPSLSAMDTSGRVIALGTFSNAFTPAICLSYAVLPPELMLRWRERESGNHPQSPWQTQAAMAALMRDGHWKTHIRKMRTIMLEKRSVLVSTLERLLGERAEIVAGYSSLFVLVQLRDGSSEQDLVDRAAEAGVRVYPTSCYFDGPVPDSWRYVLVGFAGIPLPDIEPGIETLAAAWS